MSSRQMQNWWMVFHIGVHICMYICIFSRISEISDLFIFYHIPFFYSENVIVSPVLHQKKIY